MAIKIIAEIGVNHNGDLELAKRLIEAAVEAGANLAKFQTFNTSALVTNKASLAQYQKHTVEGIESQFELLKSLELSFREQQLLRNFCVENGIEFLSTPFDSESLKFLKDELNVTTLKIGSGDLTNGPLLMECARTDCSMIISTGMASIGEVEDALSICAHGMQTNDLTTVSNSSALNSYASTGGQLNLRNRVSLLHCSTEYPASFDDVNLRVMDTLKATFGLNVGYSDHTEGIAVPIAAAALGAGIIEKHLTLDKNMQGPDHGASLVPDEFKKMVSRVREVERALGVSQKFPSDAEIENRKAARKYLVAATPIKAGEKFTLSNLTAKRCKVGEISPMRLWELVGSTSARSYEIDDEILL